MDGLLASKLCLVSCCLLSTRRGRKHNMKNSHRNTIDRESETIVDVVLKCTLAISSELSIIY